MKLILEYLKKHIGIFLLSTFFLTMEAVSDLLQPTFMSYIVDDGIATADTEKIFRFGAAMLGVAAVGALSAVMRNIFSSRTSQTIAKELRRDIYHHVQTLSLENIDRLKTASIITRITNDVTQIQEFINSCMRMMVKAPITCIGAIALIILQTPGQSPVIIGVLIIVAVLIFGNMKLGYARFGRVQKTLDKLNGSSREFLISIRVVKAFHAEEQETRKFDGAAQDMADASTRALRTMAVFSPLINLTVNTGIVLLLWISREQPVSQIGRLMASVNYMTQVLFSLGMISNFLNTAVRALASSERISEVLTEQPVQRVSSHPVAGDVHGCLEFRKVSFRYAGAADCALTNVSFKAQPGEVIGVIGPTGAGKTSLACLIPRLYDATEGGVFVDGSNVKDFDEKTLCGAVGYAAQKALLFSGSIRENLLWGNEKASDEQLRRAARIACADEFIDKTGQGYDTCLGQGGVNLSGGQKQRLSLARALVKTPKILILDDCTSALDAQTEAEVLSGLRREITGMTVILISQRISSVMNADRILCLEDGAVRGYGTHAELLAGCPTYQAIYASQIGEEAGDD